MQAHVFEAFQRVAYREAGIALRDGKDALVAARIARRMRELQYLKYLEADRDGAEMVRFLDAITTNFTSFFREATHFEHLAAEAKRCAEQGVRRLRVWCAAAATGEEPYTLAITLTEALKGTNTDFRILATDLSVRALKFAARGQYEATRTAQVPEDLRRRYFQPVTGNKEPGSWFAVIPQIRERVVYGRLNLAVTPFPLRGECDIVFCRNVMIYFDAPIRAQLIREIERLLKPGGLLFVAHSETLGTARGTFTTVSSSVYRKAQA
jgi:chemotaxis protein methyltransferase CheR